MDEQRGVWWFGMAGLAVIMLLLLVGIYFHSHRPKPVKPAPKAAPCCPKEVPGPWLMGPESYEERWRRIAPEIYEDD
jgi:hypothetical protein